MSRPRRTTLLLWTAIALAVVAVVTVSVPAKQSGTPQTVAKDEIHGYLYALVAGEQEFLPGVTVWAKNQHTGATSDRVETDCRGLFTIPPQPAGDYDICWSEPGYVSDCAPNPVTLAGRTGYPLPYQVQPQTGFAVAGSLTMAGGGAVGFVDAGFGVDEQATVSLLDAGTLATVRSLDLGCAGYAFAGVAPGSYLVRAEYAGQQVTMPAAGGRLDIEFANAAPSIQAIWAGDGGGTGVLRAAPGSTVYVNVEASDPNDDPLSYQVAVNDGTTFTTGEPSIVGWTLGFEAGDAQMQVLVSDGKGGFDRRVFSLSTEEKLRFSGRVLGFEDKPLVGALVRVDGVEVTTGQNGWFQVDLFEDRSRHVLTIQESGYMLFSRTYDSPQEERTYRLTPAQVTAIDPFRSNQVTATSGQRTASVTLQAGTLEGPGGASVPGSLEVSVGIVDPGDPDGGMPGDYLALDAGQRQVALSSYGAISVSIEDTEGNEYNLKPGATARVSIPVPEERLGGELPPSVPLWIYNETSGFWEEVGDAVLQGDAYVGDVPHFSEINADVELTDPVCMRLIVDSSLQSFLPFDVRIEVIPTGDVLVRELDATINSLYALPELSDVEFVVLDSQGTPIESTRQTVTTGPYDAACATAPVYPYTCCTSTATFSIDVPPTTGFLDYLGLDDVFAALWYTSVIDPVPAAGAGTVTTGGTTVTGTGTAFATFFVGGDLIRPQPFAAAGTVTNTAGSTVVTGVGTDFVTELAVGDIIRSGSQTRRVTSITSATQLSTNSAFDPALTGATFQREEVRLVESVTSATSLDVNTAFNHAHTAVSYEKVGEKPTLADFEAANGLGTPDAEAAYYNGADLGFGRYMKMRQTGTAVAYAVANYGTPGIFDPTQVALAALAAGGGPDLRFATVTMEHSPNALLGGADYTKFYVYNATGNRVLKADLDGLGEKFIPKLCMVCHGGNSFSADSRGDVEAEFLPFDLPTFAYSGAPGFTRADQEPEFKLLNSRIESLTTPPAALDEMIEGSYGGPGLPSPTFDDTFVPPAWNASSTERDLYNFVVKKSCRGCHVTRTGLISWASYSDFDTYSGFIQTLICTTKDMPNALLTYDNFWLSTSPHQPNVLAASGLSGWSAGTPCP